MSFAIEDRSLPEALKKVAERANLDLMMPAESIDRAERYSLYGRYTVFEALDRLLRGTGLEYVYDGGHNVAVRPRVERSAGSGLALAGQRIADRGQEPMSAEPAELQPEGGHELTLQSDTGLEEVLVTAQKRTESVQEVGIAIAAFSGERIKELGIASAFDLASLIPNVSYTGEGSVDQFNIRGVQLSDFSDGNEPPVGVYVDEVYLGTLANHQSQLYDVERVEVLRGPQGTLFGRNTVGGLVHTITRKPTATPEGYLSLQAGSNDQWIVEGALSGPLSDRVRARAAARYNTDDGWQRNAVASGKPETAKTDYLGARLGLEVDLTDDLMMSLNVHSVDQQSTPQMYSVTGLFVPGSAAAGAPQFCDVSAVNAGRCESISIFGPFAGSFISGEPDPRKSYTDLTNPRFDIDGFGSWLKFDWDLGAVNLVSITAFESVDKRYDNDPDGPPSEIYGDFRIKAEQWSQELRLSGDHDRLNWLAGLFYYSDEKYDWSFATPELVQIFGTTFTTQNQMDLDTESYAVFAQADYFLTDAFKVTAGARWTHETKDLFITDSKAAPNYENDEHIDTQKVTWRVGADWTFSSGRMLYATIATGFKSGAFNTSLVGPGESAPSGEEEITTYEIGAKTDWFGSRLRVNAAAFYNDYTDVQAVVTQNVNNVPVVRIFNVGALDIKGLELEVTALPVDSLELGLSAGWIDAEYIADDPDLVLGDRGIPLDGAEPPHTPKFNWSVYGRYSFDFDDLGRLALQVTGFWEDDVFLNVVNDPFLTQDAHSIWNARATWTSRSNRYQLEAFVDNLTDEEAYKGGFMQGGIGLMSREWKPPRMSGVKLTLSF
jgi:iron complex outermembrane receptor protein